MIPILSYFPGQTVTIFQEVVDGYGVRTDDGYIPAIARIIPPTLIAVDGYPQQMTRFDVGLYYFQMVLPKGAVSVGSYLIDIVYEDPITSLLVNSAFQIVVNAPFGRYSAGPY